MDPWIQEENPDFQQRKMKDEHKMLAQNWKCQNEEIRQM